jgi:hypothetical protein
VLDAILHGRARVGLDVLAQALEALLDHRLRQRDAGEGARLGRRRGGMDVRDHGLRAAEQAGGGADRAPGGFGTVVADQQSRHRGRV